MALIKTAKRHLNSELNVIRQDSPKFCSLYKSSNPLYDTSCLLVARCKARREAERREKRESFFFVLGLSSLSLVSRGSMFARKHSPY